MVKLSRNKSTFISIGNSTLILTKFQGFSHGNDKWCESIFEIRTLTVSNYRPSCSPIANRSIVSYMRRTKRNISRIGNDTPRGEHG